MSRLCGPTDELPPLPGDVTRVRLLDEHGRLIEEISPQTYEEMRPAANASRRALRGRLDPMTT